LVSATRVNATIDDVARVAGVSKSTVSHVINDTRFVSDDVRQRVSAAMTELKYHPSAIARSLKTHTTGTIGVVVATVSNPFFASVMQGIEEVASEAHHSVMICNANNDHAKEEQYLQMLLRRRVDGILIAPTDRYPKALASAQVMGIPIVLLARYYEGMDLPVIETDNEGAVHQAVTHLYHDGHRRIGFVGPPLGQSTSRLRHRGYCQGLEEHGIAFDPSLVRHAMSTFEHGREATIALLDGANRPTAIIAGNNTLTVGVLQGIRACRLAYPRDVGIIGFDDHGWARLVEPPLTVIHQPVRELGATATSSLLALIEHGTLAQRHTISLIVRASCAPHKYDDEAIASGFGL
jgi:LacI family transcriptional regulator